MTTLSGQQFEGVRLLIRRYRDAGLSRISHDFYEDGRIEGRFRRWSDAAIPKLAAKRS